METGTQGSRQPFAAFSSHRKRAGRLVEQPELEPEPVPFGRGLACRALVPEPTNISLV